MKLAGSNARDLDTYGPFKLIGGIQKGHPDDAELKAAVDFYREIRGQVE